jgi:hypothetical protein
MNRVYAFIGYLMCNGAALTAERLAAYSQSRTACDCLHWVRGWASTLDSETYDAMEGTYEWKELMEVEE